MKESYSCCRSRLVPAPIYVDAARHPGQGRQDAFVSKSLSAAASGANFADCS